MKVGGLNSSYFLLVQEQVLVDAECTHDGSLKHITKYEQWGWETFERRFLNEERIASITSLQVNTKSSDFFIPMEFLHLLKALALGSFRRW